MPLVWTRDMRILAFMEELARRRQCQQAYIALCQRLRDPRR